MFGKESVITIDKVKLLATVHESRSKHEAELKEANAEYMQAIRAFNQQKAKCAEQAKSPEEYERLISQRGLEEEPRQPGCYLQDYDRVIVGLNLMHGDVVTLTEVQFKHFVLNDWMWKTAFNNAILFNKSYTSKIE